MFCPYCGVEIVDYSGGRTSKCGNVVSQLSTDRSFFSRTKLSHHPLYSHRANKIIHTGPTKTHISKPLFGRIFCLGHDGTTELDVQHHMETDSTVFLAHRQTLVDRNWPLKDGLRFFDTVVAKVFFLFGSLFGPPGNILHQMDVVRRKLFRLVVGPAHPCPSHEALHSWNARARSLEIVFLHGHRWL